MLKGILSTNKRNDATIIGIEKAFNWVNAKPV